MEQIKPARVQDTMLMDRARNSPCVISGNPPPNDPHHVRSKGAQGDDVEHNICPLRHDLHQEFHKIGMTTFANKYPKFKAWLLYQGWVFNDFTQKWFHE